MLNKEKKLEAFERALDVMDRLRSDCPWNHAQTIDTLRPMTIEEVYELSDAVLKKDEKALEKELGDVFLHVIFYAKIAEEEGRYTVDIALDDRDSRRIGSGKVDIRGFMLPDDLTTTEGGQLTTSHQGVNSAEAPAMAIDNNLTTKFCANINPAGTVWLRYRLREPIVLTSYSISSANDAPERDPRTWRLQGSSDGRTWTDLDSRTDELFPSRYLTRTYDVQPADTAFTWFRLYVQQRRDAASTVFQLSEWQLFGHVPEPDAITAVAADQAAPAPVYCLDGRRLPASRSLSPGVYIVGGRKRVIGAGGRE